MASNCIICKALVRGIPISRNYWKLMLTDNYEEFYFQYIDLIERVSEPAVAPILRELRLTLLQMVQVILDYLSKHKNEPIDKEEPITSDSETLHRLHLNDKIAFAVKTIYLKRALNRPQPIVPTTTLPLIPISITPAVITPNFGDDIVGVSNNPQPNFQNISPIATTPVVPVQYPRRYRHQPYSNNARC